MNTDTPSFLYRYSEITSISRTNSLQNDRFPSLVNEQTHASSLAKQRWATHFPLRSDSGHSTSKKRQGRTEKGASRSMEQACPWITENSSQKNTNSLSSE